MSETKEQIEKVEKRIFVLDNRYIYVGKGERINDELLGDCVRVTDCYNIRYYSTDKGLTQLSYEGKTEGTILDYSLPITIPLKRITLSIDVDNKVAHTFKSDE